MTSNSVFGYKADYFTLEERDRCLLGKPHKYTDLIKAWADGKQIEQKTKHSHLGSSYEWHDVFNPNWNSNNLEFRIKTLPIPDKKSYLVKYSNENYWVESAGYGLPDEVLTIIRDGETGKIKSVEVSK